MLIVKIRRERAKTKLLHKTTYTITLIEDLRSFNMMINHSLARRIAEGSFYKFKTMLIYKVEQLRIEYGGNVAIELVNPRNTSQTCSSCDIHIPRVAGEFTLVEICKTLRLGYHSDLRVRLKEEQGR